eukprot:Lankesteria_metandrocarpae@DN5049_c0_g1_i1.p1
MGFRGIMDIILHFDHFRNVDLFHQGLYQLKCTVYQHIDGEAYAAVPHSTFSCPSDPARRNAFAREAGTMRNNVRPIMVSPPQFRVENHNILPLEASTEDQTFTTRSFLIRYCEEEVELNDGAQLRIEIDLANPSTLDAPLFIEVDLMFADCRGDSQNYVSAVAAVVAAERTASLSKQSVSWSENTDAKGLFASPMRNAAVPNSQNDSLLKGLKFKSVSYQVLRVQSPLTGVHECVPVVFDEYHFCVASLAIHTCLVDFRCRIRPQAVFAARSPRYNKKRPPPTPQSVTQNTATNGPHASDVSANGSTSPGSADSSTSGADSPATPYKSPLHTPPIDFESFLRAAVIHTPLLDKENVNGFAQVDGQIEAESQPTPSPHFSQSTTFMETSAVVSPIPVTQSAVSTNYSTTGVTKASRLSNTVETPRGGTGNLAEHSQLARSTKRHPSAPQKRVTRSALEATADNCIREIQPPPFYSQSVLLSQADRLHAFMVKLLVESFIRLAEVVTSIRDGIFTASQRETFGEILSVAPLRLPGGEIIYTRACEGFWRIAHGQAESPLARGRTVDVSDVWGHADNNPPSIANMRKIASSHSVLSAAYAARDVFALRVSMPAEQSPKSKSDWRMWNWSHNMMLPRHSSPIFPPLSVSLVGSPDEDEGLCEDGSYVSFVAKVPRLSARVSYVDPNAVCAAITKDVIILSSQVHDLWNRLMNVFPYVSQELHSVLNTRWQVAMMDSLRVNIVRDSFQVDEVSKATVSSLIIDDHIKISDSLRQTKCRAAKLAESMNIDCVPRLAVEDLMHFTTPQDGFPILFEERYVARGICLKNAKISHGTGFPIPSAPSCYRGVHFIVFVHGFRGQSCDMRLFKNTVLQLFPKSCCHLSEVNEGHTEGDIRGMGRRLADEVSAKIQEWFPIESSLGRISFVVHSLGGLIARAAVPYLKRFAPKFHAFVSLSSPHLGYMHNSNRLVEAGLWVLKKWKKSICLQQLTMSDSKDPRQSYLYEMSGLVSLQLFKHICLISSVQDQYAPFSSARIQLTEADANPVHSEMATRLLSQVEPHKLMRIDVNFKLTDKSLDTFIGRAAHIQFLESLLLMRILVHSYTILFR